jgi:hypothetical protein
VAWTFGISAILWRFQSGLEANGLAPIPPEPVMQMGLFDATGRVS